jgi:hypothetical protein
VNKVLMLLSEWWGERGTFRKLIGHADNAQPHKVRMSQLFLAQNWMKIGTHPPYSLYLAPSDFSLFGQE